MADSWHRLVDEMREKHNRKTGFMPEFERMASGTKPPGEPAFLDRAKAYWGNTAMIGAREACSAH